MGVRLVMKQIQLLILLSFFASCAAFSAAQPSDPISFNRDIRPILAETCFHCHGSDPGSRKGKLRLDREDGFFADRQNGATVVRGNPEKSPLYLRITSKDPEEVMPPPKEAHKNLKPNEVERIKQWIVQGAKWEPHWSLIKPVRPANPAVRAAKWVRNPIDTFVLARLESAGLEPAPDADRRTLARRLALDLTGLPPEPDQVEAFVNDKAPNAYEKLVDTLIESPRYGEHRARYWLDSARYADTHGLHFDNYREIWPYRDWVINAFNRNQPFDQFTIEQLAGDLLEKPTKEQILATGFHRCNMTTNEGGTIEAENLAGYARDRVETTSWVWLGLTANCAVCHDHKFDPITAKDFYSMSAFFRNTTQGALDGNIRDTAPIMVMPKTEDEKRYTEIPQEIEQTNKLIAERKKILRTEFDVWLEKAKAEDWDALIEKTEGLALHLPLNKEEPGNSTMGVFNSKAVTAKSKDPIKWDGDGKFGKSPIIADKMPLEIEGDIGDFEKNQHFSYGAWVKASKDMKTPGAVIARMDEADGYRGWDILVDGAEFSAHLVHKWPDNAMKVFTTGNKVKAGTWQHVFVTYDGSGKAEGLKIFVDGKETKPKIDTNKLKGTTKTTTNFNVGQRKTSMPLTGGSVQDVRIYSRTLSASEVQRLALQPKMRSVLSKAAKDRAAKEKDELFEGYIAENTEVAASIGRLAALEAEKKAVRERSPVAHIMEEKKGSMPSANILLRGEYDKLGEKVEPAVFSALHPLPANAPKNRLGLAQWLVAQDNPLMPRVVVNRFWQEFFGTGIVKTSEDFGIMGDAPANPELLDYLAVEFRGNWDVKKLVKLIVTSATYRQSAVTTKEKLEKDLANRLMSRGPRFRMDAENIRDYALSVSGLLSSKVGGPSVKPYQPEGVWDVVGMPESNTRNYKRDAGEGLYRRSVYTFWKRAAPPASMDILNAPSRETSCVRRERTNTPLQALVTLNDPQFIESARMLAQNAIKSGAVEDAAKMDYIARRVLARPLNEKENAIMLKIQRELFEHYKAYPDDAKALLAVGETKTDATLPADALSAWTMVCNEMLNLDETLNK